MEIAKTECPLVQVHVWRGKCAFRFVVSAQGRHNLSELRTGNRATFLAALGLFAHYIWGEAQ
jgi:hypothetical protein